MTQDDQLPLYELQLSATELAHKMGNGIVLVHALAGFSDPADTSRVFSEFLKDKLQHKLIATFDVDKMYDYRGRRPPMVLSGNKLSKVNLPKIELYAMQDRKGVPFLMLSGIEPDYRWEQFAEDFIDLAKKFKVNQTIGIHAIPMAVPHTRSLSVHAHSNKEELVKSFELWNTEITFPSSISTFLDFRLGETGFDSIGLGVHVPHYLQQTEYPETARVLINEFARYSQLSIDSAELSKASAVAREEVDKQLESNPEVAAVVAALEKQYDAYSDAKAKRLELFSAENGNLPDGEQIAGELERFLAGLDNNTDTQKTADDAHDSAADFEPKDFKDIPSFDDLKLPDESDDDK